MVPIRLVQHAPGAPGLRWLGLGPDLRPSRGLLKLQRLLNKHAFWARGRSIPQLRRLLAGTRHRLVYSRMCTLGPASEARGGSNSSTGGNSGSATLNSRAELVGLLFDGTFESVNSDWDFDPRTTRTIHVDTRYMLWVMEKVDGADALIEEMDIVR